MPSSKSVAIKLRITLLLLNILISFTSTGLPSGKYLTIAKVSVNSVQPVVPDTERKSALTGLHTDRIFHETGLFALVSVSSAFCRMYSHTNLKGKALYIYSSKEAVT